MVGSPRWQDWRTNNPRRIGDILDLIRATPIIDVRSNALLQAYFYGGPLQEIKSRDPRYSLGVHLSTVRDHYVTEFNIESDTRTYARKFFSKIFDDDKDFMEPSKYICTEWIDEPIDNVTEILNFKVNVRVNLLLPDKVLVEQFKTLLGSLRDTPQRTGIGIANKQKFDFHGWVRFGVIPYLDLQIWEKESGKKIPNRVMADAIFPPGEGGEEVVRKTTSKLADELLTLKHRELLAALAAHEIAEQNTA